MENLAARVILLSGWRRALTAFGAGLLAVLALPPVDFFAVCFVSFPVLVWLLDGAVTIPRGGALSRFWPAFRIGWTFGLGYFVGGLWWIGNALLVDAENFAWLLPFAVLGIPAVLAVYFGLAAGLARLVWSDGLGRIFMLAAMFGIAEYARSILLTGFPWNAIGYAAMPTPLLMQSASIVGLYGMTPLAVFVFAAPALLGTRRHRSGAIVLAVLLVAAHAGFGAYRLSQADLSGPVTAVRIVQPSIDQSQKWDAGVRNAIFSTLLSLTTEQPAPEAGKEAGDAASEPADLADLVIWPETAIPFLFTQRPEALRAIADALAPGQVLLTGAVRSEPAPAAGEEPLYYNSILAIDAGGEIIAAADKVHLVPFGEYLPLAAVLKTFGLSEIAETPGIFQVGQARRPLELPDGPRLLPLICYEAIFPYETQLGAGNGALLNVTNDGWYGDTPGPPQHFRQAQLRAVEQGASLIRAANNGISGAVDPYGRVIDAFALDVVGALDVTVPLKRVPTWYERNGLFTAQLIVFVFLCVALSMNALSGVRKR